MHDPVRRSLGLDTLLSAADRALRSAVSGRVVLPARDARRRHDFAQSDEETNPLELALSVLSSVERGVSVAARVVAPRARPVPSGLLAELVAEARRAGASATGCTDVTPDLVFAGCFVPAPHALVLLLPMDKAAVRTAPSWECLRTVNETYAELGALSNRLTGLLRQRGYSAHPGPALGGVVDYPSLAERAGLGARAASGLLVSEGTGPCQRIGAVFLELEALPPPSPASDLSWVPEFCARCQRCVRECPAGAIRAQPPVRADGHAACTDGDRCLAWFQSHWGCSVCVKVCPLLRGDLGRLRASSARRATGRARRTGHRKRTTP